jgi:hypothetical protein
MGQIKFVISLVLIALFGIAIIGFATNFAVDNDSSVSIANDGDFDTIDTQLKEEVEVFYTDINISTEAMHESTVKAQTDATEGGTAFKAPARNALSKAKTTLIAAYTKIFGGEEGEFGVFLTAFIAVLGLIMGLYVYKAWVGRNPD